MLLATTLLCVHAILLGQHGVGPLPALGGFAAGGTATWVALSRRARLGRPFRPAWIMAGLLGAGLALSVVAALTAPRGLDGRVVFALAIAGAGCAIAGSVISLAISLPARKASRQ